MLMHPDYDRWIAPDRTGEAQQLALGGPRLPVTSLGVFVLQAQVFGVVISQPPFDPDGPE
jgi:hypothetical protein